jgi:hypothetical protein
LRCPDGTILCPVCKRILSKTTLARRIGLALLVLLPFLIAGVIAIASHRIESHVLRTSTTASDAYKAALEYLQATPTLKGASNFSSQKDSTVERWGAARWRVSGYVDAQPAPGPKVHTFYSCVLHYAGRSRWEVEDLHFERIR